MFCICLSCSPNPFQSYLSHGKTNFFQIPCSTDNIQMLLKKRVHTSLSVVLNHCNGMSWDSHTDMALHLINNLQIGNYYLFLYSP